jgi:peptidoglycan/LPS O-acetylase OafA/YrhL
MKAEDAGPIPRNHIRHVDGMRAIAVLSVIVYHLRPQWLPGGLTGVDIFFAISGFVVTASLAEHGSESLLTFIGAFYRRRITRIVPALLVVLTVTAFLYALLIPRSWLNGLTEQVAFLAYFGLSNIALQNQADAYFAPRAEFNPFTQTWSLGVEEQFYLLAPCLIYLHVARSRRGAGAGRRPWEILVIALASLLVMALWTRTAPLQAFYSIASRFCEIAAGSLWYLYFWKTRDASAPRLLERTDVLGAVAIAAAFAFARLDAFPFPWAVVAVAGAVLVIGANHGTSLIRRILGSPLPVAIGLRSYSLYLWHWPVFVLMRWTAGLQTAGTALFALAATFALAELSWRWVESPPRRSERWRRLPTFVAIPIALALTAGCAFAAKAWLAHVDFVGLTTVSRQRTDWYADHSDPTLSARDFACQSQLTYRETPEMLVIGYHRVYCADGAPLVPPGTHNIFVLGDSHATAYIPMLHRLSVATGMSVSVYQIPGCPFVDFHGPMDYGRPASCIALSRNGLADVLSLAAPGDIVFLPSLRLMRFVDQWAFTDEAEAMRLQLGPEAAALRERAAADATQWLRPLADHGLRIIFEAPTPIFKTPPFRCADPWTSINPICSRGLVETREFEERLRAPVVAAMQRVCAQFADCSIYDPLPELCNAQTCPASAPNGRPLFFDADHLSRYGNEVLYPSFHARLVAMGTLPAQ